MDTYEKLQQENLAGQNIQALPHLETVHVQKTLTKNTSLQCRSPLFKIFDNDPSVRAARKKEMSGKHPMG
jgi:hypothetical protein